MRLTPILHTLAILMVSHTSGAQDGTEEFDPFSDAAAEALEVSQGFKEVRQFIEPGKIKSLTALAKPSIVTVRQLGRDGESRGTGSGFIVSEDGLIATNLHVIGEGRPIEVELFDGSVHEVVEVQAWDRRYDLAVIRIAAEAEELKALPLADSDTAEQGQLIAGFGAPQGLSFSVVAGVISAIRELEEGFVGDETPDYPMLQLAMPIEQGNSGGPVINMEGEVMGVVTLRHRVTDNLGFAVPGNDLKMLLEKPNPVPMSRWRTIGMLDPRQWTPIMGADWNQRGGVIRARQLGAGFGGRSLCLSSLDVPEGRYELEVSVRLDDESGAAGLAFASDSGDKHYGFYPSAGQMRLTRFEGPDVYSWVILEQVEASSYLRGSWNKLRVRVDGATISAWVNDEKVMELKDEGLRGGKVGLCKFRRTEAEFRGFSLSKDLGSDSLPKAERQRMTKSIDRFLDQQEVEEVIAEFSRESEHGRELLLERAAELAELAGRLRRLEREVYLREIINEMMMSLDRPESEIDLFEVGLQISRLDDSSLDLDYYRGVFSRLVDDAREYLDEHSLEGDAKERVTALTEFLFQENGFHGSRSEYYHHANSYVNHVLDDREGLPITLSVIFVELARRLQIEGVYGVSLPGKFMVGLDYEKEGEGRSLFVDVFEGGSMIDRSGAVREIWDLLGSAPEKSAFHPADAREIAVRMLRNLVDIEINRKQTPEGAVNYLELLLAIEPNAAPERFQRALLRMKGDNLSGARDDLDWLLEHRPPGLDYRRLEVFRETLIEE
ncbi:MAG: tetratricopeptide repeat protein [Verrucomicrobiales bacterium]|nr:tetratricopeptide repeat protein [Verrucomicrobiales bacterium]